MLIIIGIIFVFTLGFFYMGFFNSKESNEEPEEQIDDRISPLTSQGLSVQINLLRRRGLEEEMRKFGLTVPKPNPYYLVVTIDGKEYNGKYIDAAQGKGSGLITEWFTNLNFLNLNRDVKEEQETSHVNIKIMEIPFGNRRTNGQNDVVLEEIQLIYNYRSGRWQGDDYLGDCDGLGHYFGKNCEIWFDIRQVDFDNDGIPYWVEVNILKTNPKSDDSKLDPDNDGIPTSWEWKWGYQPYVPDNHSQLDPDVDGLCNCVEYQLEKWLASPFRKDIFIEVDGMSSGPNLLDFPTMEFWPESQQMVIDKFAIHDITLHIDDGTIHLGEGSMGGGGIVQYNEAISQESGIKHYYDFHFSDERKGIFHYCLISHIAGWCYPQTFGNRNDAFSMSGSMDVFRTDFGKNNILYSILNPQLSLFNLRTKYIWLASLFMHELGHSLGLIPDYCRLWVPDDLRENDTTFYFGGIDNQSVKFLVGETPQEIWSNRNYAVDYWADYVSVMNYGNDGQGPFHGLNKPTYSATVLDYSDGTHGPHDVDDWSHIDLTFFQKCPPYLEEYNYELE